MRHVALALLLNLGWLVSGAWSEEPMFPFVIGYDAAENVTNVSAWLPRPAGKQGFVRAEEGQLVDDRGPVRLWATNFCFEACFPSHEQAERVAARLAALGINCVRLHHMDSRSIWGNSPDKLTIDPEKLERLDYLIYQLKLHGVYVNINLHVSRTLGKKEGFSGETERPKYDKGLDNFEPRMIELQKKYARDLLLHVSPYTKTAYAQEPAVAMVEINNENSLYSIWNKGDLDELPEPYATTYRKLWNAWLRTKYSDTSKLRQTWKVGEYPLGSEQIVNGDFAQPLGKPWSLQRDEQTKAETKIVPSGPEGIEKLSQNRHSQVGRPSETALPTGSGAGSKALAIRVEQGGRVNYIPQLSHGGIKVKAEEPYTFSGWIKVDKPRSVSLNCMMNHEPWNRLGLSATIQATSEWKPFRFTFSASHDDDNARVTISQLGQGTVEIAGVSFRSGGIVGLAAEQRLEDDSVPVYLRRGSSLTSAARADWADFMYDTERTYWLGMYRFLKDELKVRPIVSGTQMGYGPTTIQAELDYIDVHSYWEHPHFPGKPWDSKNWYVRNVALVNSPGGTLGSLANRRVAGMAYTVSEYNHPAPNQFVGEGFPMIAAFGAFQRWSGIFSFAYCHNDDFEPRKIGSYFDIKSHTAKIAHMPACAAMFLRGDVAPAKELRLVGMSPEAERTELRQSVNARTLHVGTFGLEPKTALLHAVGLDVTGKAPAKPAGADPEATVFVSDTGQIRWDVSRAGKGTFTVDSARSKLFTGFVDGRRFDLGLVDLAIGATRLDWCTVSMVCIDGAGFDQPGRVLITATGQVENQGTQLETLKGDQVTLSNRWGSEPVLCEGITADVLLPVRSSRVKLYSLDESGKRMQEIPVAASGNKSQLPLRPSAKTVWYEAVIE